MPNEEKHTNLDIFLENVITSAHLKKSVDLDAIAKSFPPVDYFKPEPLSVQPPSKLYPFLVFWLLGPETLIIFYPSGEILCTGAKTEEDAKKAIYIVLEKIMEKGLCEEEKPSVALRNVVVSTNLTKKVNLEKAAQLLVGSKFNPDIFSGIVYKIDNSILTIFSRGIVCTGVKSKDEAREKIESIYKALEANSSFTSITLNIKKEIPKSKVALVKGKEPKIMVKEALDLIKAQELVSPKDKLLIKPNYIASKHPSTGVTTDTDVIEALIMFAKDRGVKDITVAEGGGDDTNITFDVVGVRDVVQRHGVKLVDLNRDEKVKVTIKNPLALKEVNLAKTILDSTCIINVPCLKIHELALVTLSLKNLLGATLPKGILHKNLNENLVDLASVIKPKLNVISGIVAHEGHQVFGNPVEMNVIVASRDMVAADAVGATLMGIEPERVKAIWLAQKRGFGTADLDKIEILGEPIEKIKKHFQISHTPTHRGSLISLLRWGIGNWDYHILSASGIIGEKMPELEIEHMI